jgi:cysteine desulfurase
LRFSLGHTSTAADIDQLVAALPGAVERARRATAVKAKPNPAEPGLPAGRS